MLYTLLAVSPWASRGSYLKCFFPSLEGVPSDFEHLLTRLPLRSISLQTISVRFRSGGCGGWVIWGNTPHSPSLINRPHMINRPHTAFKCYWGHWKWILVQPNTHQIGWLIAAVVAMTLQRAFSVTSKAPLHWTDGSVTFSASHRHSRLFQRSQIWAHQPKAQIYAGFMFISCVSWNKQSSSACCFSSVVFFLIIKASSLLRLLLELCVVFIWPPAWGDANLRFLSLLTWIFAILWTGRNDGLLFLFEWLIDYCHIADYNI